MSRLAMNDSLALQIVANCHGDLNQYRPTIVERDKEKLVASFENGQYVVNSMEANANQAMWAESITAWDAALRKPYMAATNLFADAKASGSFGLGGQQNAFGTLLYQYSLIDAIGNWQTNMTIGADKDTNDINTVENKVLPLPIDSAVFGTELRMREAAKRGVYGSGMGAIDIEANALFGYGQALGRRKEVQTMNGITLADGKTAMTYAGNRVYGYRNHPNRLRKAMGTIWTASGVTNETIRSTIQGWCQEFRYIIGEQKVMTLYIPSAFVDKFNKPISDYDATTSLRQWLIAVIPQLKEVKVAEYLPADEILLVILQQNMVGVITGFAPSTIVLNPNDIVNRKVLMLNMEVPFIQIVNTYNVSGTKTQMAGVLHALAGSSEPILDPVLTPILW